MNESVLLQSEHFVRSLLTKLLDQRLHYHNLSHTCDMVKYATVLAQKEHLSIEETEILLIASWFHDSGFTVSYFGHEHESALIASRFLSHLISENRITEISDCILATTKGITPVGTLQYIIRDADYGHFFESDYFERIENLRKEIAIVLGKTFTHQQWYEMNGKFLAEQKFYTSEYQKRWTLQKEILLTENDRILKAGKA